MKKPYARTVYLFSPTDTRPYNLSRFQIDLFLECPRCSYLNNRLGVNRPKGFPFTLNNAVDELLKREFDHYRKKKEPHPMMTEHKIDAIPFTHKDFEVWRELFKGVTYLHEPTNFKVSGMVDDVWVTPQDELIVVDYKATAKDDEVNLDADWQISYKRQMEVYQWLLRNNGFTVSDTGYFVYANGIKNVDAFDAHLDFRISVLPYTGNTDWIEPTLMDIKTTLANDKIPEAGEECQYCAYRDAAGNGFKQHVLSHKK